MFNFLIWIASKISDMPSKRPDMVLCFSLLIPQEHEECRRTWFSTTGFLSLGFKLPACRVPARLSPWSICLSVSNPLSLILKRTLAGREMCDPSYNCLKTAGNNLEQPRKTSNYGKRKPFPPKKILVMVYPAYYVYPLFLDTSSTQTTALLLLCLSYYPPNLNITSYRLPVIRILQ